MTAPAASRGRVLGLDAARGLALIGMIMVNVGPLDADSGWRRLYLLPYGRASILFVVVAGISMALYLRSRRDDVRRWPTLVWRAMVFLSGGLALQLVSDDVGVILPLYGVLFVLILGLQRMRPRYLLGLAVACTVIGPVLLVAHVVVEGGRHLGTPVAWGDSLGVIAHSLLLSGRYPLLSWVVPFLVGMWLASLDLTRRTTSNRLMVVGGSAAVGAFLLARIAPAVLGAGADSGYARLLTGVAHGQMPLWLISSVGGAVFVVAALVRFWDQLAWAASPLVAAGQLALTLYVVHVVVLAFITPPDGFTFAQGIAVSAAMALALVAAAVMWRRAVGIGPLERLLRAEWLRPVTRGPRPPRPGSDRTPAPTPPEMRRRR